MMTLTDRCNEIPRQNAVRGEMRHGIPLTHGSTADFDFRYELAGPENAPLLLVAGGISAGRHVVASAEYPEEGWWQCQSAAFAGYRVLAIDWVGADGTIDLPIDPSDQADALAWLLDALGEDRAAAFVGASYGAMVGMHFMARHPHRSGALLAISGAGRAHPFASACRALQRQAIDFGERHRDSASGVALARAMAILTYRTPEEFAERFDSEPELRDTRFRFAAEPYLEAHGQRHCAKMQAAAYRRLSESIDLHRIDPVQIKAPTTLVAVDQDALVPVADIKALASAMSDARFHLIRSRYGHDAFLKEEAQVGAIITQFLKSLENDQ